MRFVDVCGIITTCIGVLSVFYTELRKFNQLGTFNVIVKFSLIALFGTLYFVYEINCPFFLDRKPDANIRQNF